MGLKGVPSNGTLCDMALQARCSRAVVARRLACRTDDSNDEDLAIAQTVKYALRKCLRDVKITYRLLLECWGEAESVEAALDRGSVGA